MIKRKPEFQILLRLQLQNMTPRERAGLKRRRPLKQRYPLAIEQSYAKHITETMSLLVTKALDRLEKRLPSWVRISESAFRADAVDEELEQLLKEMEEDLRAIFVAGGGIAAAVNYVESIAARTVAFEKMLFQTQTNVIFGSPLDTSYEWWAEAQRMWANENHRLIKSLSQEYITKLNTLLTTSFQSSWSYSETVEAIRKLSDTMTGHRARLIARDQVGKLQYTITRHQFESIGMDGYLWTTARDERVRGNPFGIYAKAIPSHWEMDDKICKFSDPTVYSLDGRTWLKRTGIMPSVHPGQAIMCRCTAAPYWLPYIEEVEKSL